MCREQARNWLAGMLLILVDQVISTKEAAKRGRLRFRRVMSVKQTIPAGMEADAKKLGDMMSRSFGVEEFYEGNLTSKSLWISWPRRRIYIGKQDAEVDSTWAAATRGIDIDDIAEVSGF